MIYNNYWEDDFESSYLFMGMNARIYKITNDLNTKVYVGQTYQSIEVRFLRHCNEARWKNTKRMPIVFAIQKYGSEHFFVSLLEELSEEMDQREVDKKEVEWGLKLNTLSPYGYNLRLGNARGVLSEETKQKIGAANKGKKASIETRMRLSESHKGLHQSEITKQKLSNYWKGTPLPPLAKQRCIEANQKTYLLISPDGVKTEITNMARFCRDNGYDKSNMCELVKGRKESYRGWKRVGL